MSAVAATFVACSTVANRKQCRLVFEAPIEKLAEILTALGSPDPHGDVWCGIARLKSEAVISEGREVEYKPDPDKSERAKAQYASKSDMEKAVVRASLLCKDQQFQEWLGKRYIGRELMDEQDTADAMRYMLNVKSRSEIGYSDEAYKRFVTLETRFSLATGRMAEAR